MRHGYDVRRTLCARIINRLLHCGIQLFAGIILAEAIYEFAVFILKVLGRRRSYGARRSYAYKRDLHTVKFLNYIGLEYQFVVVCKISAYIREVRLLSKLKKALHTIVELVVARYRNVIANLVHKVYVDFAGRHCAYRLTLYRVAVVDQHYVIILCNGIAYCCQTSVAKPCVNSAVHIAGEQYHNVLGKTRLRAVCHCNTRKQHRNSHENAHELFH